MSEIELCNRIRALALGTTHHSPVRGDTIHFMDDGRMRRAKVITAFGRLAFIRLDTGRLDVICMDDLRWVE